MAAAGSIAEGRPVTKIIQGSALDTTLSSAQASTNYDVFDGEPWLGAGDNGGSYIEHQAVYRCVVAVFTRDGSGHSFTLEVAYDDFIKLRSISLKDLVQLAHDHLWTVPPLPLDPDQVVSWGQSSAGKM